jgi:hypothetical protein
VSGLAAQESWGRWSTTKIVTLHFANCLPKGKLIVGVRGHAFGPNIGRPVNLMIGGIKGSITLGAFDGDVSAIIDNPKDCENKLLLVVPENISPLALGISSDNRTLGLGLARLSIHEVK